MSAIFVPEYLNGGPFDSFADAMQTDYPQYRLENIVRYNQEYRKYLRECGMDETIKMLSVMMPSLAQTPSVFEFLRSRFEKTGIADYDIHCLPIDSDVCLMGTMFDGLSDIKRRATFSIDFSSFEWPHRGCPIKRKRGANNGFEIIELYAAYPCFDFDDFVNESRYYCNYVMTREKVDADLIKRILSLPRDVNYNLCTEHIPDTFLPVVHYSGDGQYMLVATADTI